MEIEFDGTVQGLRAALEKLEDEGLGQHWIERDSNDPTMLQTIEVEEERVIII